MGTGTER